MFTVRDVLDRLPGTSLVLLSRERGLAISGLVEDFRAGLAKHYRRRVADLLRDLRRTDLSKLFRRTFEVDGVTYRLRNRGRFSKAELLEIALTLFARGEIHDEFSSDDIAGLDSYDEDEEEGNDEGEEDDAEGDDAEDDDEIPPRIQAMRDTLRADRWSAPRSLPRLLKVLYDRDFTRLRTERFQRMLEDLQAYGIEVALGGDDGDEALDPDSESPGLDVTVRLRLRDDEGAEGEEDGADLDEATEVEEQASTDALPTPVRNVLATLADGEWSGNRPLARLLTQMYGREFTRLRSERFNRLLADLDACGVELCLAEDQDEQPLAEGAEPPRLDARIRLRRMTKGVRVIANPPPPHGRIRSQSNASTPAPTPTIRVVPDRVPRPPPGAPTKLTPYEMALLRLEFLTATPWAGRSSDPMWPNAFLDAATRGIDLDDRSLGFLRLAARSFVSGSHDPMARVARLIRALHADEWPLLLLDFERLNPDADPDAVASVVRHASELASIPVEPVNAVVLPPAPPQPVVRGPRASPVSRDPSTLVRPSAQPDGVRDLGPLDNMFDD